MCCPKALSRCVLTVCWRPATVRACVRRRRCSRQTHHRIALARRPTPKAHQPRRRLFAHNVVSQCGWCSAFSPGRAARRDDASRFGALSWFCCFAAPQWAAAFPARSRLAPIRLDMHTSRRLRCPVASLGFGWANRKRIVRLTECCYI